jgi:outer membrane protein insertion porin family
LFRGKLTFILLFLIGSVQVSKQVYCQNNFEIRKINFIGNKSLDKDFLLNKLAVEEVSWLEKKFTGTEPFLYNEELVNLDIERLIRNYQSEGFLQAKASLLPLIVNEKKQTVKLLIEIDEGIPIKVDSISIQFPDIFLNLDADSLQKRLFKKLELTKNARFRDELLELDIQIIEDALRSIGFAYVKTNYDLDINFNDFTTHIYYSVSTGPKTFFGETKISGMKNVPSDLIRKQLTFKNGDVYDKSELIKTRQVLYRLQLFKVVSVLPQKNQNDKKSPIPVEIYIEEAPRFSNRFGAGFGTEEKFRTFIDVNYRGFLGSARRLNLYAKHSAIEPYNINLRWIQPQFIGLDGSIALNPFMKAKNEPGYKTRAYGLNIPFAYIFNPRLNSKLTYYFEDVKQNVEFGDTEFPGFEEDNFPYKKSGILLVTVYDNSSPAFSPKSGINASVGFKLNGYLFGGTFSYTRLWGDLRMYHNVGNFVLAYRIMAGGIASADSRGFIPVEDRFYSGGSNSIRGWSRHDLGPKRESGTPLGGKSIFETNFEVRRPIFWRLSIVGFVEAGNVWRNSYKYNLKNLSYAAGSGIRLETPIGPVRFDVGFPIWNEKTSPQFFLSVGQAF